MESAEILSVGQDLSISLTLQTLSDDKISADRRWWNTRFIEESHPADGITVDSICGILPLLAVPIPLIHSIFMGLCIRFILWAC